MTTKDTDSVHETLADRLPLWGSLSYPQRNRIMRWLGHGVLGVWVGIMLFPILWMLNSTIRLPATLQARDPPLISFELAHYGLDNLHYVLFFSSFPRYMFNSLLVTSGVIVLTVVASTFGGYGLARIDMPFKKTFARGVLFGYMFPAILLAIPMFIFWREIGILNSYIGLTLAHTALALPFSLWLMWKFFQTVPYSLEESAQVGGASRFRSMIEIAIPIAKPGIIAVAIFAFAISWNQYTIPKVIMSDQSMQVLTVGVEDFMIQDDTLYGPLMTASFITIIPAFIFVFTLQKYLIQGFRVEGNG
ncbi:carbohydrate ABC transporter permease [Natrarchaeobius halalkaliphilus]|uniref:Carbohydrate ABC transporter permease n=1 Tax=Natrarchaeobius halalkaliphilus TaxID=1679091 RepID=A0A3N6LP59_9EURY|nr:carbohydrate ABC transporter permease [Natrarchaeobius halalkaliphilus]RQG88037.1 carbohydrate ABC transporter permease [Natrarchaeobius halalkaliphilus]